MLREIGSVSSFGVLTNMQSATIEASIFLSQAVWLFRTRDIRRRAKEAELDWDEFPEAQAWQEDRWRLPWNWKGSDASASNKMAGSDAAEDESVTNEISPVMQDQNGDIEQCRRV